MAKSAGQGSTSKKVFFVLSKLLTHFVILSSAALVLSSISAMKDAQVVVKKCDAKLENDFTANFKDADKKPLCYPHPVVTLETARSLKFNDKLHRKLDAFEDCESGRHLMDPKNQYSTLESLDSTTRGLAIALISVTGVHALAVIALLIYGWRNGSKAKTYTAKIADPESPWYTAYNLTTLAAGIIVIIMVVSFYSNVVSRDTCMEGIDGGEWHACTKNAFGDNSGIDTMEAKTCADEKDATNNKYDGTFGADHPKQIYDANSDANDKESATWQVCHKIGEMIDTYQEAAKDFNDLYATGGACEGKTVSPKESDEDQAGECGEAGTGKPVAVQQALEDARDALEVVFGKVAPDDGEVKFSAAQVASYAMNCGDPDRDASDLGDESYVYPKGMHKDSRDAHKKIFHNVRALTWIIAAATLPLFFYVYDYSRALRYEGDQMWLRTQNWLHIVMASFWALFGVSAIMVSQSISHNRNDRARVQCSMTTSESDFVFSDTAERNADAGITVSGVLAFIAYLLTIGIAHNKRTNNPSAAAMRKQSSRLSLAHTWLQHQNGVVILAAVFGVIVSASILLVLRPLQFQAAMPCDIVDAAEANAMTKMYVIAIVSVGGLLSLSYIFTHAGMASLGAMDKMWHHLTGRLTTQIASKRGEMEGNPINVEEMPMRQTSV